MNYEQFKTLSQSYNVIPVSKTLLADTLTPVSAYLRLRESSTASFLFESVEGGERIARYSFIGCNPLLTISCTNNTTTIFENGATRTSTENFLDIIHHITNQYKQPTLPNLPRFSGGLVGFIGYDAVRFIENIPNKALDKYNYPDSLLGLFTTLIAFDHLQHQITVIVNVCITARDNLETQYNNASKEISRLEELLMNGHVDTKKFSMTSKQITPEISPDEFRQIVLKAKHYITEGDIFQVVLSQRFVTEFTGDVFNAYRTLRVINPSPYLYFLDFGQYQIVGSSPEVLVRVENHQAEVYPIAGTRPRGKTDDEDKALERELLADEKERAEHIMLVDLARNDLGRVCEVGSVNVDQCMFIVRYSHVMHIASRVVGKILNGKSHIDVLKATFPAGTVSGAPKIRAMEIIDELEKYRRGFYAGGVGYFDFSGNMDFCITIRTMFAVDGKIFLQSGAGIVADSDPDREYQETINKAKALVEALEKAESIK